jgi:hypothetical protein
MRFEFVFFAIFAFVLGQIAWRYFRSGSLTGAMLGARITSDLGEIPVASGPTSSTVLRVHTVESSDDEPVVALVLVSKAPLAASMMPIKLTRTRVHQLIALLQQGVGDASRP